MKIYQFALLVIVTAILFGCANSSSSNSSSSSSSSTTSLHVVEHADTDAVTDIGDKDDTVGDILTFANKVFDEANQKEVGSDNGYCVRTVVGETWECFWTTSLADGQITVEGPFYDTKDSVLAITGGTGTYSGAQGQMKLHARNPEGTEYDFTYEITK
ncbi:MAG: Allene oxide cyclase [Chloroflexi bacterium]|nr:Allene oxide cyclase [Chloroflexota bacterium]